jgi:hypothetical protein
MGLFNFIAQACQSLAATAAPSITAMGIHIVLSLATIMLVWFGVILAPRFSILKENGKNPFRAQFAAGHRTGLTSH